MPCLKWVPSRLFEPDFGIIKSMNTWIIIWFIFWTSTLGLPIFLFKKYKITYYEKSWQHTLFFMSALVILIIVYQKFFTVYFKGVSKYSILIVLFLFLMWLLIPATYQNDYYTKKERFNYQLPRFFDIFFQQLCFLGGLQTFGVSYLTFGLIFFAVHIPLVFFVPKKFAMVVVTLSLVGGLIFAYLQSRGVQGFIFSLSIHLSAWIVFHHFLTRKQFLGIVPIKR